MTTPRYGPADAFLAPRYTGVRTFARCPHVKDLDGVDVAVVGVPFDTGTSFRVGARFGPEAVRAGSILLRPYNPNLKVDCFATQSVVDWGDVDTTPGDATALGGADRDAAGGRSSAPASRRSCSAATTPSRWPSCAPTPRCTARSRWCCSTPTATPTTATTASAIFHGTPFRRAVEEGLLLPERSVMAGMRGPLYDAGRVGAPADASSASTSSRARSCAT